MTVPPQTPWIDRIGLLPAAVARGIVTPEQARALAALAAELAAPPARPRDDEALRFAGGFGDIFVTIGLALFLGAAAYLAEKTGFPMASALVGLVLSWLLAEYFTRRRRMALPSIALLAAFVAASFLVVLTGAMLLPGASPEDPQRLSVAALGAALAAALHYRRFRVPITVAATVAGLGGAALKGLEAAAPDWFADHLNPLLFLTGLFVFALAMRIDMTDTARTTRRADIAFWLHLLAAPLIVHPVLWGLQADGEASGARAAAILGIFIALGAVALLVDRRAMLVSGLAYAGFAFAGLLRQVGLSDLTPPATLLALGAMVLMLAAFWHGLRGLMMRGLPAGISRRLPPPIR